MANYKGKQSTFKKITFSQTESLSFISYKSIRDFYEYYIDGILMVGKKGLKFVFEENQYREVFHQYVEEILKE